MPPGSLGSFHGSRTGANGAKPESLASLAGWGVRENSARTHRRSVSGCVCVCAKKGRIERKNRDEEIKTNRPTGEKKRRWIVWGKLRKRLPSLPSSQHQNDLVCGLCAMLTERGTRRECRETKAIVFAIPSPVHYQACAGGAFRGKH